ncbi:hypothetical protein MJI47_30570, partial [Salmonella enterica subsp. enterica serovar Kentucky]|nr:hypothetical protein [Salmonella enterica subsp. enterica serovar Kentucky]
MTLLGIKNLSNNAHLIFCPHENRYGSGASQSSLLSKSIHHISNSHEAINFISCYSANGSCF